MDKNELIEIVYNCIRNYRDVEDGHRFSLLEYYSITNIKPVSLAKSALTERKCTVAAKLRGYDESTYWLQRPLDINERLANFHSIKGKILENDDKLLIIQTLEAEGYPLIEGVYDAAARIYVQYGVEEISKEKIKNKIITFCDVEKEIKHSPQSGSKVKVLKI